MTLEAHVAAIAVDTLVFDVQATEFDAHIAETDPSDAVTFARFAMFEAFPATFDAARTSRRVVAVQFDDQVALSVQNEETEAFEPKDAAFEAHVAVDRAVEPVEEAAPPAFEAHVATTDATASLEFIESILD
jgi:hypothetical protein